MKFSKCAVGGGEVFDAAQVPGKLKQVNELMEELAAIVFRESPDLGVSALVSPLAVSVSVMPDPMAEARAVAQILPALVKSNCERDSSVSVYRM